ncbi:hypothetical protein JCM11491_000050 [Sporobolomyces phaffii]
MSTLFCGVLIKAASLCFAADAYDAEHRTLLAVDLICARRNSGRLVSASAASPIARVPVEIWSLVKQQLVDQALELAEHPPLASYSGNYPSRTCLSRPKRSRLLFGRQWIDASNLLGDQARLEG